MLDELLETGPDSPGGVKGPLFVALCLLVGAGLLVAHVVSGHRESTACRQVQGATWCAAPSPTTTDSAIVRLVRGYCPRLRSLPLADVVPQPLTAVGLSARPGELVLRTEISGAVVESALLGQPGHLAWVVRRGRDGKDSRQLHVVCHDGTDRAPPLELNGRQLRSALRANAGGVGLDLRKAARRTAKVVRAGFGERVSLGTFRCRTGPRALALSAGARFSCLLPLYSDQGLEQYRITFSVSPEPPTVRPVF